MEINGNMQTSGPEVKENPDDAITQGRRQLRDDWADTGEKGKQRITPIVGDGNHETRQTNLKKQIKTLLENLNCFRTKV